MIEKIVALIDEYKKTNKKSVRKSKGQFFTSLNTAKYMAAKAARETERLSILDPGCGNALLAAAVIEHCIQNKKCFHFDVTLVENDEAVMDVLSKSIAIIKQYVSENNGSVHFTLTRENFITFPLTCKFDIVISNPPYLKLRKDSKEALCMQHVLYGQPIKIQIAAGSDMNNCRNITVKSDLIKDISDDHCLFLPSNLNELDAIKKMEEKKETLLSAGYIFKTGPVVEFRNTKYLNGNTDVRMYRAAHIMKGKCIFPANTDKHQYISKDAKNLMIPNSPTVFVKRITAKEEAKRLQCCVYIPSSKEEYISIENHLNYLVRTDHKPLSESEAVKICDILNSDLYDTYYRVIGGSTQVNAGDLNKLPISLQKSKRGKQL